MNEKSNRAWVEYIFNLLGEIKGGNEPWNPPITSLVNLPLAPYKVQVLDRTFLYDFNDPSTFDDIIISKEGETIEVKYAVSANQGRIIKNKLDKIDTRVSEMEKEVGILSRDVINMSKSVMLNAKSGVINNLVLEGITFQNAYSGLIGTKLTNSTYIDKTFFGDHFYLLDMTKTDHMLSFNNASGIISPNKKYKLVLDVIGNDCDCDVEILDTIFINKPGIIKAEKLGRYEFDVTTKKEFKNEAPIFFKGKPNSTGKLLLRFFMIEDNGIIPDYVYSIDCVGEKSEDGYEIEMKILNEGNIEAFIPRSVNVPHEKCIIMNEECTKINTKSIVDNFVLKGFEPNTQYVLDFNFRKEYSSDGNIYAYVVYKDGTEEVYPMINTCEFKQYKFTSLPNKEIYFIRFICDGYDGGSIYFKSGGLMIYESTKGPSKYQRLVYTIKLNSEIHSLSDKYIDKLFYNGYSYIVEYNTKHLKGKELNNIIKLESTNNGQYTTYQVNLTTSYGIDRVLDSQYSLCNKLPNIGANVFSKSNKEGFCIENESNCYLYLRLRNVEEEPIKYINFLNLSFLIPSNKYYDVLQTKIPPLTFSDNVRFGTSNIISPRMNFSINTDLVDNIKLINNKLQNLQSRLVNYLDKI